MFSASLQPTAEARRRIVEERKKAEEFNREPKNQITDKNSLITQDDSSSEEEVDLKYIIDECPPAYIVEDFMHENLKSIVDPDMIKFEAHL